MDGLDALVFTGGVGETSPEIRTGATAAIAVVTLGVLLRFKIGEPWIVAAAGAVGLLLHWL